MQKAPSTFISDSPRRPLLWAAAVLTCILFAVGCAPKDAGKDAPAPNANQTERQTADQVPSNAFRIAFVGWFDSEAVLWRETLEGSNIEFESFKKEDFLTAPLDGFDVVLFRVMGWTPSDAEHARLHELQQTKKTVGYPQTLDFAVEATNVEPEFAENVRRYFLFPCEENVYSAASALVAAFGGEKASEVIYADPAKQAKFTAGEPVEPPEYGYFYRDARVCGSLEEFDAYRAQKGIAFPEDAPRVAMFGSFLEPFKELDHAPQDELIAKFAERGVNVYPIYNLAAKPELLTDCKPDLAIYFPRGRVLPNDEAVKLFADLNIPVLTAVLLSTSEQEWRNEPIGMTGSYYSLATALPELDGVIEPIAIGTKEENPDGLVVRAPLSERIDALVERASGWLELRRKPNAEKKAAIFYYKGPGAAAFVAQSLEVADSLYNLLTRMRGEGYDLGGDFPETVEAFKTRLEKEGRTVGQWELGAYDKFLRECNPEFIPEHTYQRWFDAYLSEQARNAITDAWGLPPGGFMTRDLPDDYGLIVPRVRFGNVVLIPQPTTDVLLSDPYSKQGDELDAVHGTGKAPPHFYVAAYLWARYGFNADFLVHFGTHGSLEFTKGKSAFLTESCFPDALVGNKPNLYIYSINNIGEAFLAKRRIRAVTLSHLTPPFTKSGLYADLAELDEKIHEYGETEEGALREEYAASIADLALSSSLIDDLLDYPEFQEYATPEARQKAQNDRKTLSEAQLEILHKLLHRYENASVTRGLHVLGRPWTEEQIAETAQASRLEPEEAAKRLRESFDAELNSVIAAAAGSYVKPSTGGDFLVNPDAAPTGRNLAGLDVEKLPSKEAEAVAAKLTDELIGKYREGHGGEYPRKVACTLWGGESTRTQGLGVAQVLYLLGVRVKRDTRGSASEVELIPSEELGRPRIDVLVQTSGQFRDSFGSKLQEIDRAVQLAADAPNEEPYPNFVAENARAIALKLTASGRTEEDARELSTARVFGAVNALSYGTGIMDLVERSDLWNDETQIADRYLANMSGVYRDPKRWGLPVKDLLEFNLDGLDLMAQTRSSNVWGPAKLDHIYEFSTLNAAARVKTGKDMEIWYDDLRSPDNPRVETARAALREELRTTLWNPKYLKGLQQEGATAAASTEKTVRNLFGWSVAQPKTVDQSVWEETSAVFVDDIHKLGVREWFEEKNPAALQDMTADMLEAVRKEYWKASPETVKKIAGLHAKLVEKFGPSGSYQSTGNKALRQFVQENLPADAAARYAEQIRQAVEAPKPTIEGLGLREVSEEELQNRAAKPPKTRNLYLAVILALMAAAFGLGAARKPEYN